MRRLALFVLLFIALVNAQAQPNDIEESFTSQSGKTYQVEVQQLAPTTKNSHAFRKFGHWGAEGRIPSVCVSKLKITREKLTVRLAAKHYLDLCNVNRAWFTEVSPFVVLTLEGGDASDSFKADFKMHGVNLIERAVRDGEFSGVFEVTHFNYPVVVN